MIVIDVLCVGITTYDLYFFTDRHPGVDEKMFARSMLSCGGGPASNAAVTVARMGLTAAFSGYLGNDSFGVQHLRELEDAGVRCDWVVRGDRPTPISSLCVKPDGQRSAVSHRVAGAALEADQVDLEGIRPKVMLFDGHEPALSLSLMERAEREGIPTLLDAGSVHPGTSALHERVDYLLCSETFALEMCGTLDPEEALTALSRNRRHVVITLGARGLIWKRENDRGRLPAYPVKAVDTTGAGDVFHGAFAGCLAIGCGWRESLGYASAAAALSCTRPGGRTGIPFGEEVEAFIASAREAV